MADELALKVVVVDGGTQTSPLDKPQPTWRTEHPEEKSSATSDKSLAIQSAMDSMADSANRLKAVSQSLVITVQSLTDQLARMAAPIPRATVAPTPPPPPPIVTPRETPLPQAASAPAPVVAPIDLTQVYNDAVAGGMSQKAALQHVKKLSRAIKYEPKEAPPRHGGREADDLTPEQMAELARMQAEEANNPYFAERPEIPTAKAFYDDAAAISMDDLRDLSGEHFAAGGLHFPGDDMLVGAGNYDPSIGDKLRPRRFDGLEITPFMKRMREEIAKGPNANFFDPGGLTDYWQDFDLDQEGDPWSFASGGFTSFGMTPNLDSNATLPPGLDNELQRHWPEARGMYEEGGEMWPITPLTDLSRIPKDKIFPHMADGGTWADAVLKHFPGASIKHGIASNMEGEDIETEYADWSGLGHSMAIDHYKDLKAAKIDFLSLGNEDDATFQNPEAKAESFAFARKLIAYAKELKSLGYGIVSEPSDEARDAAYNRMLTRLGFEQSQEDDWSFGLYRPKQYAQGGRVNMTRGGPMPATSHADAGADWHPAWLTNEEFVVNARSTAANKNALAAANADPNVKLTPHYATGFNPLANAMQQINRYTAQPAAGVIGPQQPAISQQIIDMAAIAGGPIGQTVAIGAALIGKAERAFHDSVMNMVASAGQFVQSIADPSMDPSKYVAGLGGAVTGLGDKVSGLLNNTVSPLTSALGLDLFPQVKLLSGAVGEATQQFAGLMTAIDGTAARYGDYSPQIAMAQAQVEMQQIFGEMRRANEGGTELARYLRAQGDLQQKIEDVKIKILTQMLPLVTTAVTVLEKLMPAGETISEAVGALMLPLTAIGAAADALLGIQRDATRVEARDPTELILGATPANDRIAVPGIRRGMNAGG